jgi:hypothetical protein
VDRVAVLSKGGWDEVSKTPTASNLVICFRVELHHSRNQLGIAEQTAIQPKTPPPPAREPVRPGFAGGTEIEKVTGIEGLFFRKDFASSAALSFQFNSMKGSHPMVRSSS